MAAASSPTFCLKCFMTDSWTLVNQISEATCKKKTKTKNAIPLSIWNGFHLNGLQVQGYILKVSQRSGLRKMWDGNTSSKSILVILRFLCTSSWPWEANMILHTVMQLLHCCLKTFLWELESSEKVFRQISLGNSWEETWFSMYSFKYHKAVDGRRLGAHIHVDVHSTQYEQVTNSKLSKGLGLCWKLSKRHSHVDWIG